MNTFRNTYYSFMKVVIYHSRLKYFIILISLRKVTLFTFSVKLKLKNTYLPVVYTHYISSKKNTVVKEVKSINP